MNYDAVATRRTAEDDTTIGGRSRGAVVIMSTLSVDLQIDGRRYCLFATCYSEDEECKAQRHCSIKVNNKGAFSAWNSPSNEGVEMIRLP